MTDKDNNILVTFLVTLIIAIPSAMWSGFAVSKLWLWFAVPLGVPEIGIFQAAGLTMMATVMTGTSIKDGDAPKLSAILARAIFVPAMCLFFGWVYLNIHL